MVRSRTYQATVADLAAERAKRELLEQRVEALSAERAKRELLEKHLETQTALMTFICGRINQLEIERALLVRKLTNVEIPVPQFATTGRKPGAADEKLRASLAGAAMFEDMGDDAANALGIRWDKDGRVIYDEDAAPATTAKEPEDVPSR